MATYAVYIHFDLLAAVPTRGPQREAIMRFVRSLASQPQAPGDFIDHDQVLRPRQIKILGDYAITYWVDHAVQAVMVVDISRATR